MPKDYVKLTAKVMIRHGKIKEAIKYLIEKGYTIEESTNICIDLGSQVSKEVDD